MATLTTNWQDLGSATLSGYSSVGLKIQGKYSEQSTQSNKSKAQLRAVTIGTESFRTTSGSAGLTGSYTNSVSVATYPTYIDPGHVLINIDEWIAHDSNGNLSLSLGAYMNAYIYNANRSLSIPQVSISLPKINRLSTFSLSKNNFNIGEIIQASITQYVSAYHQNLYMLLGGNEVLIQSNVSGTVDIETNLLANMIYQQIPNAKYLDSEFRLKTYDSNNNLIGTDTKTFRANVVDSNPQFNIAYEDTNATTTAITNNNQQLIQNNSTLRFKFTNAMAQHYASLSSYAITINGVTTTGSITNSSLNVDIGTLNLSDNTNATVSVTDSRGFTTTKTVALIILEWYLPTADITLNRKQNYYTETDIKVNSRYTSLDGKNTITIKYRIKKTSASWPSPESWTNLSDNTLTTFNADNQYAWDVQVKLNDKIGTTKYNLPLSIGMAIFFIDRLKRSLGLNCFPAQNNSLELNGSSIFDLIYPIGSIYLSVNNVNPGTIFGGTWEAFGTGRTLVGVDTSQTEFDTVQKTGGHKAMQQHTHTIDSASLTGGAGNFLMDDYNPYIAASGIFSIGGRGGTYDRSWAGSTGSNAFRTLNVNASHSHSMQNAGTGDSGNLQPYITCYMWKRTA